MRSVFSFVPVLSFLALTVLFSCNQTKETPAPDPIYGLASPVKLHPQKTEVYLEDYFMDVSGIDSVSVDPGLIGQIAPDKKTLTLEITDQKIPALSEMKIWIKGKASSILLKKSQKREVKITFDPKGRTYKNVAAAGSINDWNPAKTPLTLKDGVWEAVLFLNPGIYQYQLVVDGTWMLDPANPDSADNNIGGFNSELKIGMDDGTNPPTIFSLASTENSLRLGSEGNLEKLFVFWQNFALEVVKDSSGKYKIILPKTAQKMERSFIRAWGYGKNGTTNDLLIPLEKGRVIATSAQLTRDDREARIIYFVLVDRFNNGNPANDEPLNDPEVDPKADYHGGDLAGISQKLTDGYLTDLGINTLWISPITQNPTKAYTEYPAPHRKFSGYHGYWPISSTKVDHRLGSDAELTELIGAAHGKEVSVLLDFVANHVHEDHPLIQQHPDWKTDLYLADSVLNIRIWEEQRLTTWFDTFLPSLDFSNPKVIEAQVDSAIYWIKRFGIDGFRHDATKHIPEAFWRRLTQRLKTEVAIPEGRNVYQIGETFGSRELIDSYVNSGQLDGQFDFNLYFEARTIFSKDDVSFTKLKDAMQQSLDHYGFHSLMGNISGNHDLPRFMFYAGKSARPGEDEKEAGWTRTISVHDPVGYQKLSAFTAFLMTIPGIPVIYYGDEIGMTGAGDPDNRRDMRFEGLSPREEKVKATAKKLIGLRSSRLSLIYGDLVFLKVTDNAIVYARTWFDEISIVVINKARLSSVVEFELPKRFSGTTLNPEFGHSHESSSNTVKVTLTGNSFEILTGNK